mmetsp:Transcript_29084/g.53221  ORF Transcript_29084/g.53221 Transcript_29084/m.53221 type:complete len:262 (-) Transcript_29084:90-875(-)
MITVGVSGSLKYFLSLRTTMSLSLFRSLSISPRTCEESRMERDGRRQDRRTQLEDAPQPCKSLSLAKIAFSSATVGGFAESLTRFSSARRSSSRFFSLSCSANILADTTFAFATGRLFFDSAFCPCFIRFRGTMPLFCFFLTTFVTSLARRFVTGMCLLFLLSIGSSSSEELLLLVLLSSSSSEEEDSESLLPLVDVLLSLSSSSSSEESVDENPAGKFWSRLLEVRESSILFDFSRSNLRAPPSFSLNVNWVAPDFFFST